MSVISVRLRRRFAIPAFLLHHVLSVRGDAAGGTDVINSLTRRPSADVLVSRQTCFSAGHTESRNPVEFPLWPYELHDRSKCESHLMSRTTHHYLIFETAGGFCGIAWNSMGITRFQLPTRSAKATERILLRRVPGAEPRAPTLEVAEAVAAVKRYFEGEETDFSGFRLDLGEQDPFFERIYAAARRVAWGHTTSYGALANELGAGPEAARDVGQAMARNPVALIIPCHRVLAAGGKIGGFSAPGGSAAKIRMLELERIHVEPPRPTQRSFAF
jgi:methylated-DNA-[protein]-cysteine S-methyltransferase